MLFASCGVKVLERNYVKKAKQHGINQVHGKRKLCRGELCHCQFLVHEYNKTNKLSYILLEMSVFLKCQTIYNISPTFSYFQTQIFSFGKADMSSILVILFSFSEMPDV